MKEANILSAYANAKERYAAIGVDTDKAVAELEKQQISLQRTSVAMTGSPP